MAKLYKITFSDGEKKLGMRNGEPVKMDNAELEKTILKECLNSAYQKEGNAEKVMEILDTISIVKHSDDSITIDKTALSHIQKGHELAAKAQNGRPYSWAIEYPDLIRQILKPVEVDAKESENQNESENGD